MRSGINHDKMLNYSDHMDIYEILTKTTISICSKVPISLLIVILIATISLNVNYVLKDIEAENTIEGINFGFH
jgi:hypothetical protein